ncbi:MAG: hypothetical protein V4636_05525, partial [Pseudomonadota bacterium]
MALRIWRHGVSDLAMMALPLPDLTDLITNDEVDLFIGINLEEIANSREPIRIALFILRDHFMTKTYAQIAREIAALQ